MFTVRATMALLLCVICMSCGQEQRTTTQFNSEVLSEDYKSVAREEVRQAFEGVLCEMAKRGEITLNGCKSYSKTGASAKRCEARTCKKKKALANKEMKTAVANIDYDPEHIEIDVINNVAIVKFNALLQAENTSLNAEVTGQGTLEFIKIDGQWKVTHEHLMAALSEKK